MNISLKNIARNSSENNTASISSESQAIVLIFLDVFIVVGNTLTMLTVWRLRKHPLVVDVLIFALSLVDVLNALTSVTIAILMRFMIIYGKEIPWMLCLAQGWCIVAFEVSSVFIISLVCLERFIAIVFPLWHRTQLTCNRMAKVVVLVATFSSTVASLPLLGWDSYQPVDWLAMCLFNYRSSFAIFIAFIGYIHLTFVLFSAMVIAYSLGRVSKKQRRLTGRYSPGRQLVHNATFIRRKEMRRNNERQRRQLASISTVVVIFFYMSWLPLVLCITVQQVHEMDLSKMVFVASFLALSSPLANPCIYLFMWKRYRKAFIQTMRTAIRRHHFVTKRAFPDEEHLKNDHQNKAAPPIPMTMAQLCSSSNNGCSSPSFIFNDLHKRCDEINANFDLTRRGTLGRRRGQIKYRFRDFCDGESSKEGFVLYHLGTRESRDENNSEVESSLVNNNTK